MPVLLVLRHAKSDWGEADRLPDVERPLSKRGRKAAAAIGRFVAMSGSVPDLILASPARRVAETLDRAMEAGGWRTPVRLVDDLYGGGASSFFDAVHAVDGRETVLVVAHEPGCSSFVSSLTGGSALTMPTAALAAVDCDVTSWTALAPGSGTLAFLVTPRLIES
jgi:phosphohistidine phosphatase